MPLRAVIFDYGMVLSGEPSLADKMRMATRLKAAPERAIQLYMQFRKEYDQGLMTGLEYWRKTLEAAGQHPSEEEVAQATADDAQMWTSVDPKLLAWQRAVKARGFKTAILSNMGDAVRESIERRFDWIKSFDLCVWSYELKIVKPDAAIFRHTLERLGIEAEEALFLDDIAENVAAAEALGIHAIRYKNTAQLSEALIASGLDGLLPLPE